MRQTRPLPDTHPEFSFIEWPGFCEYRVENWRLARDGSGRIIRGAVTWTWADPIVPVILSLLWPRVRWGLLTGTLAVVLIAVFVWFRCSQVLHESVLLFPPHGIQFECHRGFPLFSPFFVSRNFIHMSTLEDFVIHEGLRRWDVRYFLAAFKRSVTGELSIKNLLPHFAVLLEVYQGAQRTMFRRDLDTPEG
ncbi:hypothetical protein BV22DRAFT_578440 [Leucogyrophana mollusca]|uniref:Uncharacterized protein n=1 Tax=Leucogyrophana mollusca TaxID=85980 RepID=A0ACB8BCV2_9AGAM|nr:hypothetical protein BV22DRAFT_578440 [Leucogyrophana mollusca]